MAYIGWILQHLLDIRLPQEHVATASPPQHTLKGGHALTTDDARHKTARAISMY